MAVTVSRSSHIVEIGIAKTCHARGARCIPSASEVNICSTDRSLRYTQNLIAADGGVDAVGVG